MYFIDQRSFYIQLFLLKGLCGIDSLWGLLVLRDVTAVCLCVVSGKSINMNSKHIRVYDVSAQILMCVSHIFFRLCICVSGPNMSVSSSWDGSFIKFNMFVFLGGESLSMTVFCYLQEVIHTFLVSGRQRWPAACVDYAESSEVETFCGVSVVSNWIITSQHWQHSSFAARLARLVTLRFLSFPQNELRSQRLWFWQLRWRFSPLWNAFWRLEMPEKKGFVCSFRM